MKIEWPQPAPITDTFSASQGCLLMVASTVNGFVLFLFLFLYNINLKLK